MSKINICRQEVESEIDRLFQEIESYRSSKSFREMLDFCAHFKQLSIFNAMLLKTQLPEARYVLRKSEWEKLYGRRLKLNARPYIILIPFGPVSFVYDISDTEEMGPLSTKTDLILNELAEPYKTRKEIDKNKLNNLKQNTTYCGVALDENFAAATSFAGKIQLLNNRSIELKIVFHSKKKAHEIKYNAQYLMSINNKASDGEKFASICHELGHLLCHHLPSPGWWNARELPIEAEEFEAEVISWLVCERMGIGNPSEKYLSAFLANHDQIPMEVSIDRIMQAVGIVLKMCEKPKIKEGLLYIHNLSFRKNIDQLLKDKNKPYQLELF